MQLTINLELMKLAGSPSTEHAHTLDILLAGLIQEFMRSMKTQGLSMPQIHALMYIYHAGGCPVSDLSMLGDSSSAAASQLAGRLVRQHLVRRTEDPADRRTRILRLTAKGQDLIASSLPSRRFLGETMSSLTPGQRRTVIEAFRLLARAARQTHESSLKESQHA